MGVIVDNIKTDSYLSKDGTREYGRCTSWVNFNGTGVPTIRDGLNVASITDNGIGDFTINLAQNMINTNYVVSGASGANTSNNVSTVSVHAANTGARVAPTTSSFRIHVTNLTISAIDAADISVVVYGGDANV